MKRLSAGIVVSLSAVALFWAESARALEPDEKCQAAKNKEAGQLALCLQKAEMKLVKTKGTCSVTTTMGCYRDGDCLVSETCDKDLTKYSQTVLKCTDKFAGKWQKAEVKAGGACPTTGDQAEVQATVEACMDSVAAMLDSNPCDGASVGGACWFLGAGGVSCNTICTGLGLAYDEATRTYAGSDGPSFSECNAVLQALGTPALVLGDVGCTDAVGCAYQPSGPAGRLRCTNLTTTADAFDATDFTAQRACACEQP